MQIGIISDTHDNISYVHKAVVRFNQERVEQVIHCGDIVAPFTLDAFRGLEAPLIMIFGNCDGDRAALIERAQSYGFRILSSPFLMRLAGKKILVTHQPDSPTEECDYYLHGHTHKPRYELGRPAIINPGEACGWLTGRSTVAILDLLSTDVEFCELGSQ